MNKIAYPLFLCLCAVLFTACSSYVEISQSDWQDKPVKVDGKATEWAVPLRYYNTETRLNYTISNDDSNLYYCIRVGDDKEQMRIMRAGMQFWIDTTGKNQKQVGIQFPFPQISAMSSAGKNAKTSDTSGMKHWSGKPNEMRVSGFKYPIAGTVPILNTYGIKVSIARDSSGVVVYEACIPFKTFYKTALTSADNDKMMGITIILNPMQTTESEHHSHGGDMGGGGNMRGGMGGMGVGGMGQGLSGNRGTHDNLDDDKVTSMATLRLKLKLTAR